MNRSAKRSAAAPYVQPTPHHRSTSESGAEGDRSRRKVASRAESSGIVEDAISSSATTPGANRRDLGQRSDIGAVGDAVEASLAKAIGEASAVGRFDVVAQLAKELEARRLAHAGSVVALSIERKRHS